MKTIEAIKPGPKPKKTDGTDDKRRRANPETKPSHPPAAARILSCGSLLLKLNFV